MIQRKDAGAGTVLVVAFLGAVWLAGVAAMAVGGVRAARQRGDAAADLAALAGAQRVAEGSAVACRRAGEIAAASRGRLSRCAVRGRDVEVSVSVDARVPLGVAEVRIVSRARAGPAAPEGVP
ncbi:Rv3654c family TadE-like protein [Actinomadura macrotermitis]|uniref:Putative Flp pilus-assembly TadG-like N-terminal domain-containing protein n=1 Tax=Actinomadura macrotermitis TaxID=2585200 RepID=A0A7K0BWC3_9ACTN|nr:Rv3654c family TadE-like protein [Actinomadura macrotermitis]MQY05480.1 hypothetical protein [Actinomadura macrotermitis]